MENYIRPRKNPSVPSAHRSETVPGGAVVKTSPSSARGVGLIPGQGTKILHASKSKTQNIKQKQYCNKFNKKLF